MASYKSHLQWCANASFDSSLVVKDVPDGLNGIFQVHPRGHLSGIHDNCQNEILLWYSFRSPKTSQITHDVNTNITQHKTIFVIIQRRVKQPPIDTKQITGERQVTSPATNIYRQITGEGQVTSPATHRHRSDHR